MSLNTWAKGNLGGSLEIGARGSEIPSGGGGDTPSGGGGESDTSTCTMTVVDETSLGEFPTFYFCSVLDEDELMGSITNVLPCPEQEYPVLLYKGHAFMEFQLPKGTYIEVTGDATMIAEGAAIDATGDFTVTVKNEEPPK